MAAGSHSCAGAQVGADIVIHPELQPSSMDIIRQCPKSVRELDLLVGKPLVHPLRPVTAVVQYQIGVSRLVQLKPHHGVRHLLGELLGISAAKGVPAVPAHCGQPSLPFKGESLSV